MRHGVGGRKLGRHTGQRVALYRSLVTDLFRYEKITTTLPKAKEIRSQAERLITLGKRGDLHARRLALSRVYDRKIVEKLFEVIGPRFAERPGGYTRIIKLGPRIGDAAEMARIELVE
ncbi:MAG: 50S ribosomal protein L17 [Chloroflexi bacterium]|nr:50S ribosomal protein L17 [Chloroflexota bacterium]